MLTLSQATKVYTSKVGTKVKALDNLNLDLPSKGLIFIHGRSGSGKTTLLAILGGLDHANTAKLTLDGQLVRRFNDSLCAQYRHQHVGFVFQDYNLLYDLNVYENIALPLKLARSKVSISQLDELLGLVGLEGLGLRRIQELSGGQKQRVAIARALIKRPRLILADEPTGNLDSETSLAVFTLLKTISRQQLVIVVSHDTEYAHQFADRIVELKDGQIVSDVGEIQDEPTLPQTTLKKARLPLGMVLKLGLGNLLHNKIRMSVTAIIVAFLVGILSAIYTALYADVNITADLIKAMSQSQILIGEAHAIQSRVPYDPTHEVAHSAFTPTQLYRLERIAHRYEVDFYPRTQISVDDHFLTIGDLPGDDLDTTEIQWLIRPNDELLNHIDATYLSFTAIGQIDWTKQDYIGELPLKSDEVIISSYLADWILAQKGQTITSETQLLKSGNVLKIPGLDDLRIVGILKEKAAVLRSETTAIDTSMGLLYVHPAFLRQTNLHFNTHSYGMRLTASTDVKGLLTQIRALGTFSIFPRTDEEINRYTRFSLTFLMGLVVPLLGYIALIFLGHTLAASIAYRRKTIGILRALGIGIQEIQRIFWLEAIVLGAMILGLVIVMVPAMIDVLNFALKLQFLDSAISFTNYDLFKFGFNHIIEVFLMLMTILIVLVFTLTYHINLLDPADVIRGK